jgi:vancomycin resistance protein YoaR
MRLWPRKQVYLDDLPRTHDFRFGVLFILLFAAVIGAVYAVGYFVAGDRLATGTTVAGIDVGGMRRDEARTVLQEELTPRLEKPIKVTAIGRTFVIDPQTAGITLDLEASVDAGLGSSAWDPAHMLEVLTGGESHEAVMDLDEAEFQAVVDRLAAKIERPADDATVSFAGSPTFQPGVDGVMIDRLAFAKALKAAVLDADSSLDLPLQSVEPAVTTTEASDFVAKVARPAVADDIRIRVAHTVVTVTPRVFGPSLRATTDSGQLQLGADPAVLIARSKNLLSALPHQPVNAKFDFRNGRPVVVPSRSGTTVAADAWARAVVSAAAKRGDERRANAAVTEVRPRISTESARQLEITERVGVAEVRVPGAVDEGEVLRAVRQLDAAMVVPRQTLSLQQRTHDLPAEELSVVAGALFDTTFRTGLATVERHEPNVHTVGAAGLDASVGPGSDLAVQNDTPYGVLVRSTLTDGPGSSRFVHVELWSSTYWDVNVSSGAKYDIVKPGVVRRGGASCRPQPGQPGFSIDVSRTLEAAGAGPRTETVHSRYRPSDRVACRR